MAGWSFLHIMKSTLPDGFDEPIIATVLKESLKALEYLHRHGHIHRDVKVLLSTSLSVLLKSLNIPYSDFCGIVFISTIVYESLPVLYFCR
jgi:serine/threonine protein kinase